MTYEQRERIFSKEIITIQDYMELFKVGKSAASTMMGNVRKGLRFQGQKLRLDKQGQLHIQDFFDYYRLNPSDYRPSGSISLAKQLLEAAISDYLRPLQLAVENGNAADIPAAAVPSPENNG